MSKKMIVAATGLDGLVGSRVKELLGDKIQLIPLPKETIDITKKDSVKQALRSIDFDIFLHLAAYTNVDLAEKEKELAWNINVAGTKNVFEVVSSREKKMIYISTDFVFDGENAPFTEDSPPHPISYYGMTKYEGEKIVKDHAMIVRLSYPYRAHYEPKKDIVRSILAVLKDKKQIQGVVDQIITFTFIDDIAHALHHLFFNYTPEVYHVVGKDSLSAYDAIMTIAEVFGLDTSLVSKTTYDEFYKKKAKRPKKGIVKSKKNVFYPMKSLREGLMEIKKQNCFLK